MDKSRGAEMGAGGGGRLGRFQGPGEGEGARMLFLLREPEYAVQEAQKPVPLDKSIGTYLLITEFRCLLNHTS